MPEETVTAQPTPVAPQPTSVVEAQAPKKSGPKLLILALLTLVIVVVAAIGIGAYLMLSKTAKPVAKETAVVPVAVSQAGVAASGVHVANKVLKIGFIPKLKNIGYMDSCAKGAAEAAKELGAEVTYDGPTQADANLQIPFIQKWIDQNYDVIAVSANDPDILAPILKQALAKGIKVVTWDADVDPSARQFFVNQATYDGVGFALVDNLVKEIGSTGSIGILTASLTDKNQNMWLESIKKRIAQNYPNLKIAVILPGQHGQTANVDTRKMLQMYPEIKGIIVPESESFPIAAKVVEDLGLKGKVAVIGLTTPLSIKEYVMDGTVKSVVLWKTEDLGYLTVYTAKALVDGTLKPGDTSIEAGRLGKKVVTGDQVLLGDPFVFTKDNIGNFNF